MAEFVLSPDAAAIQAFVKERGITRLVHFTPFCNLLGVYEMGALWAKQKIETVAQSKSDFFLLDYIRWNDGLRLDGRRDCINLSIQRINQYLFTSFKKKFTECDIWCILEISPEILAAEGVSFTVGNAASSYVRNCGTGIGIDALKAMFTDSVVVGNMYGRRVSTRMGVPNNCPTDRQAEVMFPDEINVKYIQGIVVESEEHHAMVSRALQIEYPEMKLPQVRVCHEDFMS